MDTSRTTNTISNERIRNTWAWAASRIGTLSGAEVIVAACEEAIAARNAKQPDEPEEKPCLYALLEEILECPHPEDFMSLDLLTRVTDALARQPPTKDGK